jgi:uncharacterized protein YrrD
MKFSEALGRKVVSLATAETVGLVEEFVVDPRTHRVVALGLSKASSGSSLRWGDIESFGPDAVTVSAEDKVTPADAEIDRLGGKDHQVLGKRVLAAVGDELGAVDDVEFDPETGEVLGILLAGETVEGSRLVGIGSYAVVVAGA